MLDDDPMGLVAVLAEANRGDEHVAVFVGYIEENALSLTEGAEH